MKSLKPTYTQFRFGSLKGRWYITFDDYHISEVVFKSKAEAVAWFKENGSRLFSENSKGV